MIEVFSILIIAAVTILLGYVGNVIFDKTKIPDVLWLLIFGMAIGPIFGLIDLANFRVITPLLTALALMFILFEAGLNMNFYQMVRQVPKGILMGVINIVVLIIAIGFLWKVMFGSFIIGALLGAIIGGTCETVLSSMLNNLRISSRTKSFLNIESIITDPLVIVISLTLIQIIISGTFGNPIKDVITYFSVGCIIGLITGICWLIIMDRLKGKPFDYIVTLAILLLIYVFSESYGGSGALAALLFGLVLSNGRIFSRFLGLSKTYTIDKMVKSIHAEISFFIRSFFFVFLGMIIVLTTSSIAIGLLIAAVAIVARFLIYRFVIIEKNEPKLDKSIVAHLGPRGLAAAVLAQIAVLSGVVDESFVTIVFTVIIATIVYSSIAERVLLKRDEKHEYGK